jgi:hypothetical protein
MIDAITNTPSSDIVNDITCRLCHDIFVALIAHHRRVNPCIQLRISDDDATYGILGPYA